MNRRISAPLAGDEVATLTGFLDYHRETLRMKVDGLDAAQLDTALAPSDLTLGGMLKHLAFVEQWWFRCVFEGHEYAEPWASVDWDADPDWDFHSAVDDTPEELLALLDHEIAGADRIVRGCSDLGQLSQRLGSRQGKPFSMRWILTHMIEEYARHNGHADLIRQSIDGVVGD